MHDDSPGASIRVVNADCAVLDPSPDNAPKIGDKLYSINGENMFSSAFLDIAQRIKSCSTELELILFRSFTEASPSVSRRTVGAAADPRLRSPVSVNPSTSPSLQPASPATSSSAPKSSRITRLMALGFSQAVCEHALSKANGDEMRAANMLLDNPTGPLNRSNSTPTALTSRSSPSTNSRSLQPSVRQDVRAQSSASTPPPVPSSPRPGRLPAQSNADSSPLSGSSHTTLSPSVPRSAVNATCSTASPSAHAQPLRTTAAPVSSARDVQQRVQSSMSPQRTTATIEPSASTDHSYSMQQGVPVLVSLPQLTSSPRPALDDKLMCPICFEVSFIIVLV
jgi:hypothetical protein